MTFMTILTAVIILLFAITIILSHTFLKYTRMKKKLEKIEKEVPTVLIVDDEPDNIDILEKILDDICKFDVVNTGEDAVEVCKTKTYPVILMDINLGAGISGIETANIIKTFNDYKYTFIVALTSYEPEDVVSEFSNAFSHFIQKPYNTEHIKELVRGLLILNSRKHGK